MNKIPFFVTLPDSQLLVDLLGLLCLVSSGPEVKWSAGSRTVVCVPYSSHRYQWHWVFVANTLLSHNLGKKFLTYDNGNTYRSFTTVHYTCYSQLQYSFSMLKIFIFPDIFFAVGFLIFVGQEPVFGYGLIIPCSSRFCNRTTVKMPCSLFVAKSTRYQCFVEDYQ
jgi:hypothetical protein